MSHSKRASKSKRRRKAIPVLAAAGLSLSLAGGITPALADAPTRLAAVAHEVTLAEEEISDVSLATFYVFDKEHAGTSAPRVRLAMGAGGCGCSGCGGCGGCWTGTYYDSSVFEGGSDKKPVHHAANPGRKYAHTAKRTSTQKSQ
ncbi:MAG: hypothetical protein WBD95_07960 [Xanthobacteraceae bacterium]